jgi:hypothetical protein
LVFTAKPVKMLSEVKLAVQQIPAFIGKRGRVKILYLGSFYYLNDAKQALCLNGRIALPRSPMRA